MARVYSNLKFMRFTDRLEALAGGRTAAPVHVRIKPINRCNHSCWYCAYRSDALALGEDMDQGDRIPTAKLFEIVDDLIAMGVQAVTFSGGGEPLLYKALPEVIRRLAAGGIRVASLTNGANLRGAMADAFAEHGTWVRVSLDGWDDDTREVVDRWVSVLDRLVSDRASCAREVEWLGKLRAVSYTHLTLPTKRIV